MTTRPVTRARSAILDEIVGERGKHATLGRKLRAGKDANWLLALILHAFARKEAGEAPTDLDAALIGAFEKAGFAGEMGEQARLYAGMSAATRGELFPAGYAQLTPATAYTFGDLERDLPAVQAAVLAMPTSTDVDVAGIHAGTVSRASARRPRRSVVATSGTEHLRAVEADLAPADATTDPFSIRATGFHCTDETGIDWLGSDEPYWIFGSMGGGISVTTKSQVFEDVDSGDDVSFGPGEGWIWGQSGGPAPLPDGEIGALVSLWEHDDGDPTQVQNATAAAFAAAAAVLAASGVAAWVSAVVTGVGAVVKWLLGFLDDDHIADQTFVFSRQTIIDQIGKQGQSFTLTRQFTDGDGDYTLTLQVSHLAPPPTTVTVPNVIGAERAFAVSEIQAAGLVAQVSVQGPVAELTDALQPVGLGASDAFLATEGPGIGNGGGGGGDHPFFEVVAQSPGGGASVAPGATVHITVRRGDL
ncbi:hypothetical protein BN12_1350005 [Nostocoides japonicum T1-X7]|uniref:PASTA domain-containing protein n=1 Tax=Nostocoides japonicum T1-X7 TaxID=1194083 RepID=A0A077LX84_9MICO|nr:hypothetical protein [Tetrasphaera japonica]CCH76594.1 hypothetical protein BN12_1350005 [Tetrasphaera japonica T1-X7]